MAEQKHITNTWIFNMESTASLLIALGGFCKAMVDLGFFPGDLVYRWAESCFLYSSCPFSILAMVIFFKNSGACAT